MKVKKSHCHTDQPYSFMCQQKQELQILETHSISLSSASVGILYLSMFPKLRHLPQHCLTVLDFSHCLLKHKMVGKNVKRLCFLRNIDQPLRKICFLSQKITDKWRLIIDSINHHECVREQFILSFQLILITFILLPFIQNIHT